MKTDIDTNTKDMIIGDFNKVKIIKHDKTGYFVKSDGAPAFLSGREVKKEYQIGEELTVFVYTGSKGELLATLRTPKITIGKFEALRVVENTNIGTFVDWGLNEDLLVPFDEQDFDLEQDDYYVIFLYLDEKSKRLRGTTVFYEHLDPEPADLSPGDEVDLLVVEESKLGITVIINGKYEGLLYNDEVFKVVNPGEKLKGYIKKVREDKKIDVTLQKFGYRKVEPNAEKILEYMRSHDGFLELTDKSDPELIKHRMQMSKKTFKKAVGALYKQRLIELKDDGIYLSK